MNDEKYVMVPADEYNALYTYRDAHEGECEEWARIVDRLKAERDKLANDLGDADRRLRQLEGDLKGARTSRDTWRERARKAERKVGQLKEQLKAERELARMWPRYEDGTPLRYGDRIVLDGKVERVQSIEFHASMRPVQLSLTGVDHEKRHFVGNGETFKRPPLMAADGQPIEIGQTLYGGDGQAWEVRCIHHGEKYAVLGFAEGQTKSLKPEWLTHEKPDSLERIVDELRGYPPCFEMSRDALGALADRIEKLAKEAGR